MKDSLRTNGKRRPGANAPHAEMEKASERCRRLFACAHAFLGGITHARAYARAQTHVRMPTHAYAYTRACACAHTHAYPARMHTRHSRCSVWAVPASELIRLFACNMRSLHQLSNSALFYPAPNAETRLERSTVHKKRQRASARTVKSKCCAPKLVDHANRLLSCCDVL